MILTLKVLDQDNDWAILEEYSVTLKEYSIPAQSLTSVNYFNVEGRIAKCSFNTADEDVIKALTINLPSYTHSVNPDLTVIQGEIYDELLGKTVFTGFLSSLFDYDDYFKSFENIEIHDSVHMLIKYWLPWCYESSIARVIGTTFDSLLSASLYDNDYTIIPESEKINKKMFPYQIVKRYQDNLQNGQLVQDLLLTRLDVFINWQDGMTAEEFYEDAYISNNDVFTNRKFYVRKSNAYLTPIDLNSVQLAVCLYEYDYIKTTFLQNPNLPRQEYIREEITVQTYIINSFGEIDKDVDTYEVKTTFLEFGQQSENYGELFYENLLSPGTRLYDTYYLNAGFTDIKNPVIISFAGDNVAVIPGDWDVFFSGTAFLNRFSVDIYPKNIEVLKGLLLANNIGIFTNESGDLIFENKYKTTGLSFSLDVNEVRSKYVKEKSGNLDEKDLDVFINKDEVLNFIRKGYIPEIAKSNKTKEIITKSENIEVGTFIYLGSNQYYILMKDLYSNYPFVTYKGKGNL